MTKIHKAVPSGNLGEVARIIEETPDMINARDESGNTPLHLAVACAGADMVSLLLEKGADTSAVAKGCGTPLQTAELFLAAARESTAATPETIQGCEEILRLLTMADAHAQRNTKKGVIEDIDAARKHLAGLGIYFDGRGVSVRWMRDSPMRKEVCTIGRHGDSYTVFVQNLPDFFGPNWREMSGGRPVAYECQTIDELVELLETTIAVRMVDGILPKS